jgi:hypothetical protein
MRYTLLNVVFYLNFNPFLFLLLFPCQVFFFYLFILEPSMNSNETKWFHNV